MGFRLKQDEVPAEGYRRILVEQVSTLLRDLGATATGGDRMVAVHNARRRCKRIRSVLRLIREHCKDFAKEENGVFREIARGLSPYRDADVRLETFEQLEKVLSPDEPERFTALRDLLAKRPDAAVPWAYETSAQRAADAASAARERFKALKLPWNADFTLVEKGLKSSYKKGRRAMKSAYAEGSDPAFHEWRKRVKDLDYQLQTLRLLWPLVLKGFHKELRQLSEILGKHNDYAVLRESLDGAASAKGVKKKDLRKVLEILEERQTDCRAEARAIGERLYAEAPSAFMKRIQAYWTAWKEEGSAVPTGD